MFEEKGLNHSFSHIFWFHLGTNHTQSSDFVDTLLIESQAMVKDITS